MWIVFILGQNNTMGQDLLVDQTEFDLDLYVTLAKIVITLLVMDRFD